LVCSLEKWSSEELQRLDHKFGWLLTEGEAEQLESFFPGFAKDVEAERGRRHLPILIGVTAAPSGAGSMPTVHHRVATNAVVSPETV